MKAFLDKISQLSSVRELLLLDGDGEPLYEHSFNDPQGRDAHLRRWQQTIEELGRPATADFIFERGRCWLIRTPVGTLLVGVDSDLHLQTIREGCTTVADKLQDTTIRRNVLLRLLTDNRKNLRPAHIRGLQSVAGPEVAAVLIPLLNSADRYPAESRGGLIEAICLVLGHCRSREALAAVKGYLHSIGENGGLDAAAAQAARIAIAQLELDNPAAGVRLGDQVPSPATPAGAGPARSAARLSAADQRIQGLIGQNRKEEAVTLIMEAIREHAEKGNFHEAERYRQMLIATDSMALREIISAAEIIEDGRSASLNEMLIATWKELIGQLSLDEFSALYHAGRQRNSVAGEVIVEQGDFLSNLFFVNSGRVQLYTTRNTRELPFRTVEEGEIFGAECFFDISVWTVSARSLGAQLTVLTWKRLAALKESYPALQDNLMAYCARFRTDHVYFQKPSTSRRRFERRKMEGRATMELLDPSGRESGQIARGDLLDLGQGGVSFVLRFQRKEYATDLLGKRVKVIIRPEQSLSPLHKTGQVKAVRCHDFVGNDYSVHLEFDEALGASEVAQAGPRKNGRAG